MRIRDGQVDDDVDVVCCQNVGDAVCAYTKLGGAGLCGLC